MAAEGKASRASVVEWHLRYNHFPPLPAEILPVALDVLELAESGAAWDDEVALPEGVSYRGSSYAPLGACVDAWHLADFLREPEGDPYYLET